MIKVSVPESSGISSIVYYGNVDTVITHKSKYSALITGVNTDQFVGKGVTVASSNPEIGEGDPSLR